MFHNNPLLKRTLFALAVALCVGEVAARVGIFAAGYQDFLEGTAPSSSAANTSRVYADSTSHSLKVSSNGSGYYDASAGLFLGCTYKTSGVSFTTTAFTHSAVVTACGGGGGGGGTKTEGAGTSAGAGAGGSGSCSTRRYTLSPSTSYTIAIGAAGTAGDTSPGTGGTGGNSTFSDGSTTITGAGGTGGVGADASNNQAFFAGGASGAVDASGDSTSGWPGGYGVRFVIGSMGGPGGSCPYGVGGASRPTQGAGNDATGRCSGGGGAETLNTGISQIGGVGTGGVDVICEYH